MLQPVGADCYNGALTGEVAATMGTPGSSVNASGPTVMVPAVQPVTYDFFNITAPVNRQSRKPDDPCHTIARSNAEHAVVMQPVAFHPTQDPISSSDVCHAIGTGNGQGCATAAVFVQYDTTPKVGDDLANCLRRDAGGEGACVLPPVSMQVRRLTPVECERLQGFPDAYTQIPWRKKPASECPDGPRYKALGNSWAVPVVRWIGRRIARAIA